MKLAIALLVALAGSSVDGGTTAPAVYADDSIIVHAAIAEAGTSALRIGDTITLVVETVFDPDEVQVERLDADWFRRAFADVAAVSLYRSGEPVTEPAGRNRVRMRMQWQFQVLDCPQAAAQCPSARRYELPLASFTYRLASATEPGAASRAARFRPWPGSLDLVPSIRFDPRGDTEIGAVIAGGAWPAPKRLETRYTAGTSLLVLGGSLLAAGFIADRRRKSAPLTRPNLARTRRWERAALQLEEDSLGDEAWSDLLRRCITWYCLDELGQNPFEWLRADAAGNRTTDATGCRVLFRDVIAEGGIDTGRRGEFRARLARMTGNRGAAG